MYVMTGPQRTVDERGNLAEMAGLHGALLVGAHQINWAAVRGLYRLSGWGACSLALADVTLAEALSIPMYDLTS